MDDKGNLQLNLVDGLDNFPDKVLFIASECNTLSGGEHQRNNLQYFPSAELAVIRDAGHTMFGKQHEESLRVIHAYLED
jgi:proline iminopeptidase